MFETLTDTPLFGANLIMQQFKSDPRADKIDLGLGVYRNDAGVTPVMEAVKEAEARLLSTQTSKSYLGLAGDDAFSTALLELVVGAGPQNQKWSYVQTPGGVAALRLAVEIIASLNPQARIWISSPSWANHGPIMRASGLQVVEFRYLDPTTQSLDFEGMLTDLRSAAPGDAVLLQACCHNPTGVDLSPAQWDALCDVIVAGQLLPILDVAYQGFGKGLEEDMYGVRALSNVAPEAFMAVTCSKTFSNYRDRAGILAGLSSDPDQVPRIRQKMLSHINTLYAMPPDHAAAVVHLILSDPKLKTLWMTELREMQMRVTRCRKDLAQALRQATNGDTFDFLSQHQGMFSMLPISKAAVENLRVKHGIYILPSGRINLAGLANDQVTRVANAIAAER